MQRSGGGESPLGQTLRLLSANLRNGGADASAFSQLVRSLEPDVVAVQEIAPDQAEALCSVLPFGEVIPSDAYDGMGIALRRPAELSKLRLAFRDAHVARLHPGDWPGLQAPVEVINVHIAAPHMSPPLQGFAHRRRQLRGLERHLIDGHSADADADGARERPAQVLLGDFNATPLWPVYRRISSHLTDAAAACAAKRGGRLRPTWAPWSGSPKLLRIDHGFVRGLRAEAFQVVDIPGSDHSAIVMDLVPSADVDGTD